MKKLHKIGMLFVFILLVQVTFMSQTTVAEFEKGKLKIHGSNTVFPITNALADLYELKHEGVVIEMGGEGSSVGIQGLIDGEYDIAAASRAPKSSEHDAAAAKGRTITMHKVGVDGLSLFVNPDNPISELSTVEISMIYNGTYKYWNNVTSDLSFLGSDTRIKVIERDENSGTHGYFNEFFLDDNEVTATDLGNAYYGQYQSTADLVDAVAESKNAIGYGGVSYIGADVEKVAANQTPTDVRPLKVIPEGSNPGEGILPTSVNIKSGDYPVSRPLFYLTDGTPDVNTAEGAWIALAISKEGQAVVEQVGYVAFYSDPEPYTQVFQGYSAATPGFELIFGISSLAMIGIFFKKYRRNSF